MRKLLSLAIFFLVTLPSLAQDYSMACLGKLATISVDLNSNFEQMQFQIPAPPEGPAYAGVYGPCQPKIVSKAGSTWTISINPILLDDDSGTGVATLDLCVGKWINMGNMYYTTDFDLVQHSSYPNVWERCYYIIELLYYRS